MIVLAKAFVPFEVYEGWIRKCHIIQNLNSQAWTELRLYQDSNRYHDFSHGMFELSWESSGKAIR